MSFIYFEIVLYFSCITIWLVDIFILTYDLSTVTFSILILTYDLSTVTFSILILTYDLSTATPSPREGQKSDDDDAPLKVPEQRRGDTQPT